MSDPLWQYLIGVAVGVAIALVYEIVRHLLCFLVGKVPYWHWSWFLMRAVFVAALVILAQRFSMLPAFS